LKALFKVVLAFGLALFLFKDLVLAAALEEGKTIPNLQLSVLRGKNQTSLLKIAQKHKLVLVDFWASWCTPCKDAMPQLNNIYLRHKRKGVFVVGVNVDDTKKTGIDFAAKMKVKFQLLYDQDKHLVEKLGIEAMPTTIILDHKGRIKYIHKGYRKGDEMKLEKQLLSLLK